MGAAERLALSEGHHTGDMQELNCNHYYFLRNFFSFSTCEMALKEAQLEMHILYSLIRVWLSPPSPPYCFKLSSKQNEKPPVFQWVQHLAEWVCSLLIKIKDFWGALHFGLLVFLCNSKSEPLLHCQQNYYYYYYYLLFTVQLVTHFLCWWIFHHLLKK